MGAVLLFLVLTSSFWFRDVPFRFGQLVFCWSATLFCCLLASLLVDIFVERNVSPPVTTINEFVQKSVLAVAKTFWTISMMSVFVLAALTSWFVDRRQNK